MSNPSKTTRINKAIQAPAVRLIGANGHQWGILPIAEAQRIAKEEGTDLVEISPQASPPVCKLMDYSKYLFEQNKHKKKLKKTASVKEMAFRPTIDTGDYLIKLNKIKSFIKDGHKVKITVKYRGRELAHKETGLQLIERLKEDLADCPCNIEQDAKLEGRQIHMLAAPCAGKAKKNKPVNKNSTEILE